MRRLLPIVAALTLLLAACAKVARDEGVVVGVTDGDTVRVLVKDPAPREIRVRLHGIDAPERKQALGSRAKQELSSLVFGKTVRIEKVDTDRYGRTVARLFVDGKDVNAEMVRRGFAWWYERYAPNDPVLKAAQDQARTNKLGLWRDAKPEPPWEFRGRERER